jgi:hypothetical protein
VDLLQFCVRRDCPLLSQAALKAGLLGLLRPRSRLSLLLGLKIIKALALDASLTHRLAS